MEMLEEPTDIPMLMEYTELSNMKLTLMDLELTLEPTNQALAKIIPLMLS